MCGLSLEELGIYKTRCVEIYLHLGPNILEWLCNTGRQCVLKPVCHICDSIHSLTRKFQFICTCNSQTAKIEKIVSQNDIKDMYKLFAPFCIAHVCTVSIG